MREMDPHRRPRLAHRTKAALQLASTSELFSPQINSFTHRYNTANENERGDWHNADKSPSTPPYKGGEPQDREIFSLMEFHKRDQSFYGS